MTDDTTASNDVESSEEVPAVGASQGDAVAAPAAKPESEGDRKQDGSKEEAAKTASRKPARKSKKAAAEPPPPHPLEAPMKERFGDRIGSFDSVKGYCAAVVPPAELVAVCQELKEVSGYNYLRCISGLDRGDQLEVAYNLMNMETKEELILKVKLDRESPSVPTLCSLWKTADWLERETYDLFGIEFEGHPDLRRILLPDDWEGYPLRKDYEYRGD